ncbi:MAG: NAD-dependent epimerase/dehydratase family protein [Leptolyngbya sp. SIO4C1]|nr:NAD-dependent epimerase/dehydratase family protein [Leptolyngbya sp. SIO4C1]
MKALVTGASGFTGSHLVKALQQRGDKVVALVRRTSSLARLTGAEPELVYGDITDPQALAQAMQGVDVVFHIAAYVDLGIVNEAEMARVNVEGTRAVLDTAIAVAPDSPPKLVYCSTIGVFGDTQGQVVDETFERTQANFSSAYDRTKYEAQQLVDAYAAQGHFVVSLMPAGILGPGDPHFGPVIDLFLRRRLKLWPGGDRVTGVVHVEDLVAALILAAEQGCSGEHYIISAGELSTREMFQILSQKTGIAVPAEAPEPLVRLLGNLLDPIGQRLAWNPPLSRERVHYIYDRCVRIRADKAKRELGWQPQAVDEILADLVAAQQASS